MSVPSSAYDVKAFSDLTTSKDYLFAKLLSEYGGWTGVKAKFYLDGVLEGNEGGQIYFIGFVDPNGTNKDIHKSERVGDVWSEISLLLDAGLNCKPEIPVFQTQSGNATKINVLNNAISVRALFKSSYYNDTTGCYVDVAESEHLGTVVTSSNLGTISQNSSFTFTGEEAIVPDSMILFVGKTYVLTLRAANSEGDRISSSNLSLSPAPGAVNFKFGTTLDLAIAASAAGTVYVNRRITDAEDSSDGVVFYSNLEATLYPSTGYYLSLVANELGHYKFYRVTNSEGRVTEINKIVSRHQDIYYYYSVVSAGDAIQNAPSQITLYYKVEITPPDSDFENRTYYVSSFVDAAYAAQGYYVKEDRTTVLYVGANGAAEVLVG